jgi:membrane protein involved in colicin uptake
MDTSSASNGIHGASSSISTSQGAGNDSLATKIVVAGLCVCATAVIGTVYRRLTVKATDQEREKDERSREKVENALEELTEKERQRRRQLEDEVERLKQETEQKQKEIQRLKELKEKEEKEARQRQAEV